MTFLNEQCISEMQDNTKQPNICIIGVPGFLRGLRRQIKIFEEIMAIIS